MVQQRGVDLIITLASFDKLASNFPSIYLMSRHCVGIYLGVIQIKVTVNVEVENPVLWYCCVFLCYC